MKKLPVLASIMAAVNSAFAAVKKSYQSCDKILKGKKDHFGSLPEARFFFGKIHLLRFLGLQVSGHLQAKDYVQGPVQRPLAIPDADPSRTF
jgi:hypothetical protein